MSVFLPLNIDNSTSASEFSIHQLHEPMGVPRNIEYSLEEAHIKKVWELLHEKFSFNVPVWQKEFKEYLGRQPRNTHEMECFIRFGLERINPVLNRVLGRSEYHSTWYNMLNHIIKKG